MNYTSCSTIFGIEIGLKIMKYFELIYVFSILIGLLLNILVGGDGLNNIFLIFILFDIFGLTFVYLLKKNSRK